MPRRLGIGIAFLVISLQTAGAQAQVTRDVLRVGPLYMLRTQQVPHTFGNVGYDTVHVAASADRCAYAARSYIGFAYLRQFDTWAVPLHAPIDIDPDLSYMARIVALCCDSKRTWVLWIPFYSPGSYARPFDPGGLPLLKSMRLADGNTYYIPEHATSQAHLVGVLFTEAIDGPLMQLDLRVQFLDFPSGPFTPAFPVANTPDHEYNAVTTFLPDDSLVLGYTAGPRLANNDRVYLRRVYPDQRVGPPVRITDVPSKGGYVRLLRDGTLLVHYWLMPEETAAYLRRFDTDLRPLGEPVPVDPLPKPRVAATTAGQLVIVGNTWDERLLVRLYDETWTPVGERFELALEPSPPKRAFAYVRQPVTYGDDGSIWVGWSAYGGGYPMTAYLTQLKPFDPGDLNYDRKVDNFDIDPFVLALTNPEEYKKRFPGVPYEYIGDCNFDGQFNNFDIDPFVKLLAP